VDVKPRQAFRIAGDALGMEPRLYGAATGEARGPSAARRSVWQRPGVGARFHPARFPGCQRLQGRVRSV